MNLNDDTIDDSASTAQVIADLAYAAESDRTPEAYPLEGDSRLVVTRVRTDERIETHDLEQYLPYPDRPRGSATVHDPADFAEYVLRVAYSGQTTVWADINAGAFTAIINDHATYTVGGWRDHRVGLTLQGDRDWNTWVARDGKLTDQASFAEFIEDVAHTITTPDAATMLEVSRTMTAKRRVEFAQGTRLQSGDVQLRYQETTDAKAGEKGDVEVPETLTVHIAPWLGVPAVDLTARLRYRIEDGRLRIGYQLLRADLAREAAFRELVREMRKLLGTPADEETGGTPEYAVPVFLGAAPQSIHPSRR